MVSSVLPLRGGNNSNENRKDRLEEDNYLIGIKGDLQKDLRFLLDIKKDLDARKQRQRIVDSLYSRGIIQEKQIQELGVKRLQYAPTTFMSTAGNYNSLVSEGRISLIQNRELQGNIQQIYERMYPRIEKRGDRLDAIAVQITWDHRYHMKHGRFNLEYVLNSGYVEDIHRFHDEVYRYVFELVDELILYLPKVLKMIDLELDN